MNNKKLNNYLNKHGTEKISNKHLMFVNELLVDKTVCEWGMLYKLSNVIYNNVKKGEDKTLNEVLELFNKK